MHQAVPLTFIECDAHEEICGPDDWRRVVEQLIDEAESAATVEQACDRLLDAARIYLTELGDPEAAQEIVQVALELNADDRSALYQLVELYSACEMWSRAVDAVLRIAELERDPFRRGKHYQAAGAIARHHLHQPADAVDYFNAALDCLFGEASTIADADRARCMAAFEEIVELLSSRGEWEELERNYRRMIKRLDHHDPALADLWQALGRLCRDELGQNECAITAFEVASALDSDRLTRHRILIDLYEQGGPEWLYKAIERRHRLLRAEPHEADHYHALAQLYSDANRLDEAWCACRALVHLHQATYDEAQFFEEYRVHDYARPPAPMTNDVWDLIRHPDEDPLVNAAFALTAAPIAHAVAVPSRKLRLHTAPTRSAVKLQALFSEIATVLGGPPVESLVQPELDGEILLANARDGKTLRRLFVLGRVVSLESRRGRVVNAMARTLAYARPESYLRLVLPSRGALETALTTAVSVFAPELARGAAEPRAIARLRDAILSGTSPSRLEQLGEVVRRLCAHDWRKDMALWSTATDATARRAGLLICGDLDTAIAGIAREPRLSPRSSAREKATDLLVHSVSEQHFAARRALGVALSR